MEFLLVFVFTLFLASIVHGSIGFGFGMLATSVVALFFDLKTTILFLLIPTMVTNVISILSEGKFFEAVKKFWFIIVLLIIGSVLGTFLLVYFNASVFKVLLAFIILFYLFQSFKGIKIYFIKKFPTISTYILGLFGGVIAGITNNVAPLMIIYTIELNFTKKDTIQLSNLSFLFTKMGQFAVLWYYDLFTVHSLEISALGVLCVVFGMFIGIKLRRKIDKKFYVKLLKMLLFVIALMLIFSTIK